MTWATDRLDAVKAGAEVPPVVSTLRLGGLDDWGPGWATKRWEPCPEVLNVDGSLFGGYLAALADQMLAFAAMTVVPADRMFRTINLQMQFFRVGRAQNLDIDALVIAQTRSLISCRAHFKSADGKVIAEAAAQQHLIG